MTYDAVFTVNVFWSEMTKTAYNICKSHYGCKQTTTILTTVDACQQSWPHIFYTLSLKLTNGRQRARTCQHWVSEPTFSSRYHVSSAGREYHTAAASRDPATCTAQLITTRQVAAAYCITAFHDLKFDQNKRAWYDLHKICVRSNCIH